MQTQSYQQALNYETPFNWSFVIQSNRQQIKKHSNILENVGMFFGFGRRNKVFCHKKTILIFSRILE